MSTLHVCIQLHQRATMSEATYCLAHVSLRLNHICHRLTRYCHPTIVTKSSPFTDGVWPVACNTFLSFVWQGLIICQEAWLPHEAEVSNAKVTRARAQLHELTDVQSLLCM